MTEYKRKSKSENETKSIMKKPYKLYDYQEEAVKWMKDREDEEVLGNGIKGGLLCMLMGMGKTLTALYHTIHRQIEDKEEYPTLVVVSKTLLYEWRNQGVNKFFNGVRALYFHKDIIGKRAFKSISLDDVRKYSLVITTYDVCLGAYKKGKYEKEICHYGDYGIHKDKVIAIHHRKKPTLNDDKSEKYCGEYVLYETPWKRLICDESQRFANPGTTIFKAIMALYGEYKWCLTGTPIRNYDTDIWAQLRFCGFNRVIHGRRWRKNMYKSYGCDSHVYISDYKKANITMPEKEDCFYYVDMDKIQLDLYKSILQLIFNMITEFLLKRNMSYACILAIFTRLRQIVIAPYLLHKPSSNGRETKNIAKKEIDKIVNQEDVADWVSNKNGVSGIGSPKVAKVLDIVKTTKEKKEKVIIFSMFTSALKLCQDGLSEEKIDSELLIGDTRIDERLRIIEEFKEKNNLNVLLIHYKVGGEGINLTEATHVIPLEPWWTHAVHNQGIFRAWRRGQTKKVYIHWVLVNNSIEHAILKLCQNKQNMSNSILYGTEEKTLNPGLGIIDLRNLVGYQGNTRSEEQPCLIM